MLGWVRGSAATRRIVKCDGVHQSAVWDGGAVLPRIQYLLKKIRLDRENVFSLALVALKFKTNLAHSLAALARPDFVLLLALGSSFGTGLLVHLLLAAKTLLLETLDNIDSATPLERSFAGGV
jgi:hypothetical protein